MKSRSDLDNDGVVVVRRVVQRRPFVFVRVVAVGSVLE